jgi:membrane protein
MKRHWNDLRVFARLVVARFVEERCNQMVASLTFTTLLSLVPLIAIALTILSAFPMFSDFSSQVNGFVQSYLMPETGGKLITRYMQQFAESATRLTAFGIVFLAIVAMWLMHTIESAFNTIWRVTRPRSVKQRILVYWSVITLAPVLIGLSLSLTSWLSGLRLGIFPQVSVHWTGFYVLKTIQLMLTTVTFGLLFTVVPNRQVSLRHAFVGGLVSATAFETMGEMFATYINAFPTYKLIYGAFASIPIFLMWVYLSWLSILMGAVITAVFPHWRKDDAGRLTPSAQFCHALRALKLMMETLHGGHVQTLNVLSSRLGVGYDEMEKLLVVLAKAGIVRKTISGGWVMIRDPYHINVSELFTLFVFDLPKRPTSEADSDIYNWLEQFAAQTGALSNVNIAELLAHPAAQPTPAV